MGIQMLFLRGALPENNVIAGEMWHSSSVGCAPSNVREVCFDSCSSSSLIPLQVLGVMVCTRRLMISFAGLADGGETSFNPFNF